MIYINRLNVSLKYIYQTILILFFNVDVYFLKRNAKNKIVKENVILDIEETNDYFGETTWINIADVEEIK